MEINSHFKHFLDLHKHEAWVKFLPNFFLNLTTIIRVDSPDANLNDYCICILSLYMSIHTYIYVCIQRKDLLYTSCS